MSLSACPSKTSLKSVKKGREDLEILKSEINIDDHIISVKQLLERYSTSLTDGLTDEVAAELLIINGSNALKPPKVKSRWLLLLRYIFGGFASLLWVGVFLSITGFLVAYLKDNNASHEQLYLAIILFTTIIITGFFGFYQERANQKIMEGFNKMIPKNATVIRNGETKSIPSEDLVLGDLVEIAFGDCVPADIRLISCDGMKVDNSSLTGESEPQFRAADNFDKDPFETPNLIFYGTNVIEGLGRGIVISCGDQTVIGHIAGLTSALQCDETLIKKELRLFVRLISILSIIIGVFFFTIAMIIGIDFFESFLYAIAIILANVPEGILVTMTACLTLTARRMAKKNCLVKNLQAIETLGATTVICSDKTGTLTQNKMSVVHFHFDNTTFAISEKIYKTLKGFSALSNVAMLCNRAVFMDGQDNVAIMNRKTIGDSSEAAILKAMEKICGNVIDYRAKYPKIFEVPFNSTNKYQLSIHIINGGHTIVLKGAPEKIIALCNSMQENGETIDLTYSMQSGIKKQMEKLANFGERVIGCADMKLSAAYQLGFHFKNIKNSYNFPHENFRFVGFISMMDPPRPGVFEAVQKCKTAGVRVIMVTGDHPITGMAIARKCGILTPENKTIYDIALKRNISITDLRKDEIPLSDAHVITGTMLREMNKDDLDRITAKYVELVFARTSPQQKLLIVESFQRNNDIVAVTGDGVNDSPALKKANIGIAMGISGSDVSKEAADMILLDDNFSTIVTGIEEGRLIFDNLKKSIAYMLTSNLPEMLPFIMFVLISVPNALSVMAILVINIGTDLWPGISLAYEKSEADIMRRMPRDPNRDRLVNVRLICFTYLNIGFIQCCAGFSCFFITMAIYGFMPDLLFGIRKMWESPSMTLVDYYGREWSYRERMILEKKCFSAYFLAIVTTQIADCIICKTRRLSIFTQGCTNWMMNTSLLFEVALALFVVYCPGINTVLQFAPIHLGFVLPAVPFALIIFVFDEIRRMILRRHPQGWVERETYF